MASLSRNFSQSKFAIPSYRQQREREELELRHRVELDNFRRRRKHPFQAMAGLPDEMHAFTVGSCPVSGSWSSPPRSPVLPPTNGFVSSKAQSFSRGMTAPVMSSIPNSPVTSQSPLTFMATSGVSSSQSISSPTCSMRPAMGRSFSDCATSHVPSPGKSKTLTDDLLRMIGDLGSSSKMGSSRGATGDASLTEQKLTLNQMKNRRQMSSDESSPSPQLSPASMHRSSSLAPQSPPSPSASVPCGAAGAASTAITLPSSASTPSWPQLHYRVSGSTVVPAHHHHAANHQRIPTSLQYAPAAPSTTPPMQPQWLHQLPTHVYPKQGASWSGLPQGISMSTYLQMMHQQQQQYFSSQPSSVTSQTVLLQQPPPPVASLQAASSHNSSTATTTSSSTSNL